MVELQAALSRRSLSDQIADSLLKYIVDQDLHEGDALPSTAELAERFDVSRTVVREALAVLGGRGVLTRSQGKESVVATPGTDELTTLLQFRLRRATRLVTADVFDCRMALEVTAARTAAQRADAADVDGLRQRLAALRTTRSDADFHRADIALHRAIVEASGNALILLILDSLVGILREVRATATRNRKARGQTLDKIIEEHAAVIEAIANRDAEAAAAAMTAHLSQTRAEFERGKLKS